MFRAWNITSIPYPCSRSYIKVNVNKIICRCIQENNQKEVLSGQKMIGAIFLEILVRWNTLAVQNGHRDLVSGIFPLPKNTDYCPNLMWCAVCHIAVLLLGKIWMKSSLSCWYSLQQVPEPAEGRELPTWQQHSDPVHRKTPLPNTNRYKFADLKNCDVYIPF